ncbi:adenylate/guanylate cyclase domain-containing protein [Aquimarina sp. 2201CG5-10]|uniref:adenylate/guanylate cyclase domain-containing protein n=1 Tax=Aquimarina callyspongiae TaxID=3098150 RepID=UPI002AB584F1|nr:adenylate/guanylate cyclase domain-containing protein [Aquimarina sp. 2201CG5-10]MDY8137961.1 adenylate/guanylate cyclase domain-containing protein [Aquimarina sp. 2201CG5-10]
MEISRSIKEYGRMLLQSVLFWSIALGFYSIFRFFGIKEEIGVYTTVEYKFIRTILGFVIAGFLLGIVYAILDFIFEKFPLKRMTLGFRIIIMNVSYFVTTVIISTLILKTASKILEIAINTEPGWWWKDKSFWSIVIYLILMSFVLSFIKIATEKFGKGVFFKMLTGKYRNPQEEKRIFMFLDLKDSTTIAESLGHYTYSQFIQDCFYDLNQVVPKYDAEIYQYVGDEAVLCWPYQKGISHKKCIELFFDFRKLLQKRYDHYINRYERFPVFKAGLHGGNVMVTEVGTVKKELAYHGDVINISARIQSKCNEYNEFFLISSGLLNDIQILPEDFAIRQIGDLKLKGKNELVHICAVNQA